MPNSLQSMVVCGRKWPILPHILTGLSLLLISSKSRHCHVFPAEMYCTGSTCWLWVRDKTSLSFTNVSFFDGIRPLNQCNCALHPMGIDLPPSPCEILRTS